MNTYTKKKGRIAIAWLVIVTMVFATMYTPFAVAEDDGYKTNAVFSNFQKFEVEDDSITKTTAPASTDFIFIKQASEKQGSNYLWTPTKIEDQDLLDDILLYVRTNDSSLGNNPQYDQTYWDNFNNFIWGYDDDLVKFNDTTYSFTLQTIEDMDYIVIEWEPGTISHINFGEYDELSTMAQVILQKELNGAKIADYDGEFEFSLVETDSSWNPLVGAEALKAYNDETGEVAFESMKFTEVKKHYYKATETNGMLEGVTYDADPIHVMIDVVMDNDVLKATVTVESDKESFTNTFEEKEYGQIPVKKTVELPEGIALTKDQTFLVGLFDENGNMYDYAPLELIVMANEDPKAELTTTGTFTNLPLDKTYYVFEVYELDGKYYKIPTENGKVTPTGLVPWESIAYTNNEDIDIEDFGDDLTAPTVEITNVYPSEEQELTGSIMVTKTVTVNNKPFASNRTFYVGLFADEELTTLIAEKSLTPAGKYEASFDELEAGATFYVAETDGKGTALTKETAKEMGFDITINGKKVEKVAVVVEGDMMVDLVNNFKSEEFPLTGDDSNMSLWLFLAMLGVAGALAPFAFRKKEAIND